MMRGRGLAFKLSVLILVPTIAVVALMSWYTYRFVRGTIVKNVEQNARELAQSTIHRVDTVLVATEKVPQSIASFLEDSTYSKDDLLKLIRLAVEKNPEIYGATIAFEPYAFDAHSRYFAPYYYRRQHGEKSQIELTYLGGKSYRYFQMDWYQRPRELNHPVWSEPYYDEGGGDIIMSTYSVPFYRTVGNERRFVGVVTADISLDWLTAIVSSIRISQTGYAFLISKSGRVIAHPRRNLVMKETIFSIAEQQRDPKLRRIGEAMIRGESGFVLTRSIVAHKAAWMVYAPVPANGWALGAIFPQDELMADIGRLNRVVLTLGAAGTLLLLLIVVAVGRSITGPVTALASASEEIARGHLDVTLPPVRSGDEVGRLTEAFGHMQQDLRRYIADLEEHGRTLERKVEERTHELSDKNTALEHTLARLQATQQQLVVQEKLASLGALTAGIAHEIKNPLNFVNNFAELSIGLVDELRAELDKHRDQVAAADLEYLDEVLGDLQQNADKIREHGKRADGIVRAMLQHSRGASAERLPTDLNALLAEYVNLAYHGLRAQDPSFNVSIESAYDPAVGSVDVVPQDISRAFLNIVNNACYATNEKRKALGDHFSPTVRVQTKDLGDRVEIRIRDNGPGIPAAVRDKIFNPFFTTKPPGQGTGLGLSITHEIVVQQHKGELRVESEEGSHTECIIVLPRNV